MLSSNGNLLKRFFVSVDGEEKRVIDSNELVSKRLSGSGNAENMIAESDEDGEADGSVQAFSGYGVSGQLLRRRYRRHNCGNYLRRQAADSTA